MTSSAFTVISATTALANKDSEAATNQSCTRLGMTRKAGALPFQQIDAEESSVTLTLNAMATLLLLRGATMPPA